MDHEKQVRPRKIVPPVYLLFALIAMAVLHRFVPIVHWIASPYHYAGLLLLVIGVAVTVSSAGLFKRLGTPVVPFAPSTLVVTTGMFRWTRNPMYLGMTLGLLGIALYLGTVGALLPIPIFVTLIHLLFIRHEERFMEELFGAEYVAYKRRVRRWI